MEREMKQVKPAFKMRHILFVSALLCAMSSHAQEVVWASKVVSFSSQVGQGKYAATKALGKPDASPDSTWNGWQPNGSGKEETIVVEFDTPLKAKNVLIVEAMNTGYVRRVAVISDDGIEYDVAHYSSRPGTKNVRLTQINVADFDVKVTAVKIILIPIRNVPTTIDAVGITTSTATFVITKTHEVVQSEVK
jgi:OmpA-OmpF porin, OOP family